MRKLLLRGAGDGAAKEVALERADPNRAGSYRALVDGRSLDLEVALHGAGAGWLRVQGRMLPFRSARSRSSVEVWIGGRRYVIDVVDRTARRTSEAGAGAASNDLTAPMPGTILRIDAKPGERFAAHAPLIVMESMKMEMTLSVPGPTVVKEVLCREGELVEMGELLARLEPARDEEPTTAP